METDNKGKDIQYFKRQITRKVGKAIHHYQMIDENELIVIGVSGGKDSLALIDILATRLKHTKAKYQLAAIHVSFEEIPYKIDVDYIQDFCTSRNVSFYHKRLSKPELLQESDKPICFICSWNRRKVLLSAAAKLGARKLALGHHLDDAIETLLMNMSFQGSISSMPATLNMFGGKMKIIRPLIYLQNSEVLQYAEVQKFRKLVKECPFRESTKRNDVRKVIETLEVLYPDVKFNLFNSMKNIQEEYLP